MKLRIQRIKTTKKNKVDAAKKVDDKEKEHATEEKDVSKKKRKKTQAMIEGKEDGKTEDKDEPQVAAKKGKKKETQSTEKTGGGASSGEATGSGSDEVNTNDKQALDNQDCGQQNTVADKPSKRQKNSASMSSQPMPPKALQNEVALEKAKQDELKQAIAEFDSRYSDAQPRDLEDVPFESQWSPD